jgi:hypothetical protein
MTNEDAQQIKPKKPVRYCFFMTGNPVWLDIAKDLSENGIAEPVLWLGDDRLYQDAHSQYGNKVQRMLEFVHRPYTFKETNYAGQYADYFLSDSYLRAKDICIKMMDRLDLYGVFNRLDREVYFHQICIWALSWLEKEKPQVLLMIERPHSHAQYLIYEICLYLNIKVVHFVAWAILPLNYLYDVREGRKISKSYPSDKKLISNFEHELDGYIKKLSNLANNAGKHEPSYMRHQRLRARWNRLRGKYSPINPYSIGVFGRFKIRFKKRINLANSCKNAQVGIGFSGDYVYFPLHYEPERTTNPDGGKFHDHFLALMWLRKILPTNVRIIVKEHPSQFFYADKGSRGRSPLFYDLVKNINGINFIGTSGDSIDLIKKSVFVATITGSVGLEAALMGKKCITFGHAWFDGCPNIFGWTEALSYKDVLESKVATAEDVSKFLKKMLMDNSVPCLHNPSAEIIHERYVCDNFYRIQREEIVALLSEFFKAE